MNEINLTSEQVNDYYKSLNLRFDRRVQLLIDKGYEYFNEYNIFARTAVDASNKRGFTNPVLMHADDFHFYLTLSRII